MRRIELGLIAHWSIYALNLRPRCAVWVAPGIPTAVRGRLRRIFVAMLMILTILTLEHCTVHCQSSSASELPEI